MAEITKGISFLNPVDIDGNYLKRCAEYAISHGVNHFEIIGPIHNCVKGNIDGMTLYRKYSQFNDEKDSEYIHYCDFHMFDFYIFRVISILLFITCKMDHA